MTPPEATAPSPEAREPVTGGVRALAASDRPRERLLREGAEALSDADLLAVILRSGLPGRNVMDLCRDVLVRYGSLTALVAAPPPDLPQATAAFLGELVVNGLLTGQEDVDER